MRGILVFGRTGQVAMELSQIGGVTTLGRHEADLMEPATCAAAIQAYQPRAVINAAGYTTVDQAEQDEARATIINGAAPVSMAEACAALHIPLVHISTDYVFSGTGTHGWAPSDITEPQNAYGRSKLAGEKGIRSIGAIHAILRTSWVFSPHGSNFVKTMLRISETSDELKVVDDQVGGPTPARAIAAACSSIADKLCVDPGKSGTYHFSGAPDVSWYDFARAIFAEAGREKRVLAIKASEYHTPARRPLNSRLDCHLTEEVFSLPRPDWRQGLEETLKDLGISR